MSDARVEKAIRESIMMHEDEIQKAIILQGHVANMMAEPGMTGHALWSLTSRYKEFDRSIGDHRTSIRNLKANL